MYRSLITIFQMETGRLNLLVKKKKKKNKNKLLSIIVKKDMCVARMEQGSHGGKLHASVDSGLATNFYRKGCENKL